MSSPCVIPVCAGTTRYRACRGAKPLCFSLVSPMNGGRRGLTQDHAETAQQDAAGGLRVSHPHLDLSPDGRWFRLVQGVKRGRAPLLLFVSPMNGGQRGLTRHCSMLSTNRPGSAQCRVSQRQVGLVGLPDRVRANIYRQTGQSRQGGSIKRG